MAHRFLAICRNENQELMLKILMSTEFQVLVKRNFPVIGLMLTMDGCSYLFNLLGVSWGLNIAT